VSPVSVKKLLYVVKKPKGLIWCMGILHPGGISTEFPGEGWQINSSRFLKLFKFKINIGSIASDGTEYGRRIETPVLHFSPT